MKKLLIMALTLTLAVVLVSCQGNDTPVKTSDRPEPTKSLGEIKLKGEEAEFSKALEPVSYREEEEVQSSYYKTVVVDGENYYEVQPVGEDPIRMPVNETVIYGIDSGDCAAEKICLKLSNGEEITQYRLHVTLEAGTPVGEDETEIEAPTATGPVQELSDSLDSTGPAGLD